MIVFSSLLAPVLFLGSSTVQVCQAAETPTADPALVPTHPVVPCACPKAADKCFVQVGDQTCRCREGVLGKCTDLIKCTCPGGQQSCVIKQDGRMLKCYNGMAIKSKDPGESCACFGGKKTCKAFHKNKQCLCKQNMFQNCRRVPDDDNNNNNNNNNDCKCPGNEATCFVPNPVVGGDGSSSLEAGEICACEDGELGDCTTVSIAGPGSSMDCACEAGEHECAWKLGCNECRCVGHVVTGCTEVGCPVEDSKESEEEDW